MEVRVQISWITRLQEIYQRVKVSVNQAMLSSQALAMLSSQALAMLSSQALAML